MAGTVPPERRMANDIAANHGHLPDERAAAAIAGHLERFWDPRMRTRLFAFVDSGAEGLDPVVVAAVKLMR
jgi:formate dehydrogenase subunit delta